jgi:DNA-binding SARP family transcriptional activator
VLPEPQAYQLLGGFAIRRAGVRVPDTAWERPMAARLVRFLLVHRGGAVPEDVLLDAFWPGRAPAAARRCLAVAASQAHKVLDGRAAGVEPALRVSERTYQLVLRPGDAVDAEDFELAAAGACAAGGRAALVAAARRWAGEPLPEDRYADWAAGWRGRLLERYREVLAALAGAELRAGDAPAALRSAARLLALDPLDESAHRLAMRAYAIAGRRARALEQYWACRTLLVERAGLEPSLETTTLQLEILAGGFPTFVTT